MCCWIIVLVLGIDRDACEALFGCMLREDNAVAAKAEEGRLRGIGGTFAENAGGMMRGGGTLVLEDEVELVS